MVSNHVKFFCKTDSQLASSIFSLGQAPKSLISLPETPVWLGGNFCSVVLHTIWDRDGGSALLIPGDKAIRKELSVNCNVVLPSW